jgi:hypothetical protein
VSVSYETSYPLLSRELYDNTLVLSQDLLPKTTLTSAMNCDSSVGNVYSGRVHRDVSLRQGRPTSGFRAVRTVPSGDTAFSLKGAVLDHIGSAM